MIQRISLEAIKKAYPNPISARKAALTHTMEKTGCEYCVGGAFCCYTAIEFNKHRADHFPSPMHLGMCLKELIPNLPIESALDIATEITELNDQEQFDKAWVVLAGVLELQPGEPCPKSQNESPASA